MAQTRYYSSTSGSMSLIGAINSATTSVVVDTTTGLPASVPFTIILDPGLASMEICDVTAVAGTTLTVTRGRDGTSAQSHDNGAVVRHGFSARDFDESRAHEDDTSAHGATGAVVGTTNTQALTNKDLSSGTNTFPSSLATLTGTQSLTNKDLSSGTNTFPTSLATLTGTQTLTNKTMSGASNTFSNIPQSAVTNLTTDVARITAIETNLGSQTTFAATSASKDGKRLHWGLVSVTPNSTGYATITHGAGFTPSVVVATPEFSYMCGIDSDDTTSTTFTIRLLTPAGAAVTTLTKVAYCCYE